MKGKLIVIEGTDCSGKETQTNLLMEKLKENNISTVRYSFPMYDSPTGKIVGGPYLGKSYICDGWFDEKAPNVDPKVSALYYAADRKYNIHLIEEQLNNGVNVILDRYCYSNMAHQGGKIVDKKERLEMYEWLSKLEFDLLKLPVPDIKLFLHMPYKGVCLLKNNREEDLDQNELDENHLINAEKAYIEIASKYEFRTIECMNSDIVSINSIKSIDEISEEVYKLVIDKL